MDDHDDRQVIFAGKIEVALVMRGDGHDRAGAVAHQDVIGDPDRDPLTVDRVDCVTASEDAGLFAVGCFTLDVAHQFGFLLIGFDRAFLFRSGQLSHQVMFRRQDHEGGAPERVGTGGEDFDLVAVFGGEDHGSAFGAVDPVGLQGLDLFGPVHVGEIQQLIGVVCDAEEPLAQVFLDDLGAAAFTMTVFALHLFAGQGGVAVGAEIHRGVFLIGQVVLEELGEEPLGPFIIFGVGRDGFPAPVEHRAHRAELAAHVVNVAVGPLFGVDRALDGGVFSRQAEGIKTHREHHIEALHPLEARPGIRGRHRIPVTDVQVAGRIGQHRQGIELGLIRVDVRMIELVGVPAALPLGFNLFRFICRNTGRV